MASLNGAFRARDETTDVLSFPSARRRRPSASETATLRGSLGDIVISVPQTKRQARSFGVPLAAELLRLLIHGVLHLLGYDHERVPPRDAAAMRRLERKLTKVLAPEQPR